MPFKDLLKALPNDPSAAEDSINLDRATPDSPKSLLTTVSDCGITGGFAAAMGSCSEPIASLVGGLILGRFSMASAASAGSPNIRPLLTSQSQISSSVRPYLEAGILSLPGILKFLPLLINGDWCGEVTYRTPHHSDLSTKKQRILPSWTDVRRDGTRSFFPPEFSAEE